MAELDKKKKSRIVVRGAFTRSANELEQLLSAQTVDVQKVHVSWELLHEKYDDLKVLDSQLYELLLEEATEEQLLTEIGTSDTYKRRFMDLRLSFEKLSKKQEVGVDQGSTRSTSVSVNGNSGRRKFRLPTIEFKRYDGNIKDWLPFWAQFKKLHEDPDIDEHDKIEYLIQATVPNSRARQLVESFPAMEGNYEKIIECMQSRFGREDLQIEVYVRELLKLILNNSVSQQKMDLCTLYDKIETQIRALETLGITSDKCSAMLFPLIESCLPHELLRVWQRSAQTVNLNASVIDLPSAEISLEIRLRNLMQFLKNEVENEQRISLAAESFGLSSAPARSTDFKPRAEKRVGKSGVAVPSATDLVNCEVAKCIFCNGPHATDSCFKARNLSFDEKKRLLTENRACFRCLIPGHSAKKCRVRLRCVICSRSHQPIMCLELPLNKKLVGENVSGDCSKNPNPAPVKEQTLSNYTSNHVFLPTLRVMMRGKGRSCVVRALIDSGSQRSYILKSTAIQLGYRPKRKEKITHCLFGGTEVPNSHLCYDVTVYKNDYSFTFEALDQSSICSDVSPIFYGPWCEEMQRMHIDVSDAHESAPIELLIGADVAGTIYTGGQQNLKCGLVAIETKLGWTLMGKTLGQEANIDPNLALTTLSLLVKDACISELWRLDTLGITEPSEKKTREELANDAREFFLHTTTVNQEGRYEVRLPWLDGHPPLPDNYVVAKKRLTSTVRRLKNENLIEKYEQVLKEWVSEGVIEELSNDESSVQGHYLPHRPVIKENSSTKIRPVFDASAHEKNTPSLNDCLEKGLNLIEEIPSILLRLRENRIGVVSDIRKAFLQISVHPNDRNFLKFLWIGPNEKEKIYRHRRVVFGVNCSPFLLGETIEFHLSQCLEKCEKTETPYTRDTIVKLSKSFYVDNCVSSVSNEVSLKQFIQESTLIMQEGKFDLRGWEHTQSNGVEEKIIPVLGLKWQLNRDTLMINGDWFKDYSNFENVIVTKRLILSVSQRIFDPIGFTCASTLIPKLWLQRLWEKNLRWDDSVDAELEQDFRYWFAELPCLFEIEIPRWIGHDGIQQQHVSLHTFCDASGRAFSCVIFLRVATENVVSVYLLAAKARVAPLRKLTIPRLELMAASIGARLYANVINNLEGKIESYFWSDSSTVLSWIQRKEEWGVFVWNRVAEIRSLTSAMDWRHVPGTQNPADLPSRGCSPRHLLQSKWWEGPDWLYEEPNSWPCETLICDETEINEEKKKQLVTALLCSTSDEWHLIHFSDYTRTLRMIAWIFRFNHNVRNPNDKRKGELIADEVNVAERFIMKVVQSESFSKENEKILSCLNPFRDEHGLLRVKSKISAREDLENFRFPIILPSKHILVENLILEMHKNRSHVGAQILLSLLRENYWILGGRRTIRSVLSRCVVCKRYTSKSFIVKPPPLPLDRVRVAVAFEVTGVDMAGPLYLKTGNKAWVCLFTCAVYRAVHFELCTSLSSPCFMQALRRFVARRGRPKVIYSDNGTNFVGTENALSQLDWEVITKQTAVHRITWRFNPPTAAWWGGFWERLVGIMKQLLRRVLGRSCLDYEELVTVLCDCESMINSRPLTYVSNDPKDLVPITPSMYLRDQTDSFLPDCDIIDQNSLSRKWRYKQTLRDGLRRRFRIEYLGQLQSKFSKKKSRPITLGEIVLVGNDNDKRLDWPLGRIVELLPGKDNQTRLVRVETARGQILRPIQRIYPLECQSIHNISGCEDTEDASPKTSDPDVDPSESAGVSPKSRVPDKVTRSGRVTRLPKRFL